jgi:hypothetical protein
MPKNSRLRVSRKNSLRKNYRKVSNKRQYRLMKGGEGTIDVDPDDAVITITKYKGPKNAPVKIGQETIKIRNLLNE